MSLKRMARAFSYKVCTLPETGFNNGLKEVNELAYIAGANEVVDYLLHTLNEEILKLEQYPMMGERKIAIQMMREKIRNEFNKLREEE